MKEKIIPFMLALIFKVSYDITYLFFYYPYCGYMYADKVSVNMNKYLITWLVFSGLFILSQLPDHRRLKWFNGLFFIMSVVPTISSYWIKDKPNMPFVLITLYWSVFYVTMAILDRTRITGDFSIREIDIDQSFIYNII